MRNVNDLGERIFIAAVSKALNELSLDEINTSQIAAESLKAAHDFYLLAYGEVTEAASK